MELTIVWGLTFLVVGVGVGLVAGLLGLGGGAVLVPLFTLIFIAMGMPVTLVVHMALATAMLTIVPTSMASAHAHWRAGFIDRSLVLALAPAVVVASFGVSNAVVWAPPLVLSITFAVFIAYVAVSMLRPAPPKAPLTPKPSLMLAVGGGIGAISALVSIGGGTLTVPFLHRCGLPLNRAIACSSAVGVAIACAASMGYLLWPLYSQVVPPVAHSWGFIYWPAVILVSSTSIVTAPIGARLAHRLPINVLKCLFAGLLLLLSGRMLWTVVSTLST